MKNFSIRSKLLAGFGMLALITLLGGILGFYSVYSTERALKNVALNNLPGIMGLELIYESQVEIHKAELILLYEMAEDRANEQYKRIAEAWEKADRGRKLYEGIPRTRANDLLWKDFLVKWHKWKEIHENVIALLKQGYEKRSAGYMLSYGEGYNAYLASEKLLKQIIDRNVKEADAFARTALPRAAFARVAALIGTVIGVLLALFFGIFIARSITSPVNRVIAGLSSSSDQVAAASSQVSAASQSLAEGSSEQASAIEQTSASVEELSAMTTQNAENANQANNLMNETSRVVNEANESMQKLTGAMKEITSGSEDMAKIIKTIDEIAFQTNLLALNAAVEAARAGEAGAGFAVVADEVRNLAMRSAESAKNTANLIDDSIRRIKNGSDIVAKTNEAFDRVLGGAKKVSELIGEIAAASNEQAQGITQIGKAISEMDKVVQQNAANAEQSASASEELNAQAMQMKDIVAEMIAVVRGGEKAVSPTKDFEAGRNRKPAPPTARLNAPKSLSVRDEHDKIAAAKAKIVKPNEIIPMNDSDEFKDF